MDAKGQAFADRMGRWTVLITNGHENLAEVPHITDDLAALETLQGRARALDSLQQNLRSQFQAVNKEMTEVVKEGEKLRSRLGATLKGKYGFTSETLIKFGFRPLRTARSRKSLKKPAPEGQGAAKT
ncbi:MAG TPA: hypothetical protein VMW27_07205 [Thermoanaerobaculia bacterium]|nr:hypothetical protein [Thermoanaerobaculia bacterium]